MEFEWHASQPGGTTTTTTTTTPLTTRHPPIQLVHSLKAVHETIYYLHEFNVLVCKQHVTAIQNLDAHLRDYYAVASKLRKEIVDSY
jgi:hypothetical protein